MTSYPGIDYSLGQSNFNPETGIHFGVIHSGEVGQVWYDVAGADYGEPCCPSCGNPVLPFPKEWCVTMPDDYTDGGIDGVCHTCKATYDSQDLYSDTPIAWVFNDGEYKATQRGDDCDIFVLKSPYFTYAQFCSPCAPGACYLLSPLSTPNDGNRCYCFGHDWFEEGKAPYPVYSVATGELVNPEK
jgi:hypothetical protein